MIVNQLRTTLTLFVVIVLSACGGTLLYQVEYPPVRYIKDGERTILLVNNVFRESINEESEDKREVIYQGSKVAFQGAIESLSDLDNYTIISQPDPIPIYKIYNSDSLLRANEANYMFTLNDYFANIYRADVEKTKNEDGSVSKEAFYNLEVTTSWSYYKIGHGKLETFPVVVDRPHSSRGVFSGALAVGPNIKNSENQVNEQSRICGKGVADSFFPLRKPVSRYFYANKEFASAWRASSQNQFDESLNHLLPLSQSENSKVRAKALYNMAVCYEAKGNIEEALEVCSQSAALNNRNAKIFQTELEFHNQTIRNYYLQVGKLKD